MADLHKPEFVDKIWGWERILYNGNGISGKILFIAEGKSTSQHEHPKEEAFYVVEGSITVGELTAKQGEIIHIPANEIHQIIANENTYLFEFGTQHIEDQTIRYQWFELKEEGYLV